MANLITYLVNFPLIKNVILMWIFKLTKRVNTHHTVVKLTSFLCLVSFISLLGIAVVYIN
jgi:hypothetical protein